ncbi:hypothetical protein BZG36_00381 [Bifiguratus adelaidae]|uniref:Protein N-terminal glutamine amidohydrolase n=1 Tax=Bifiguratus adelaidae TaxID=1938954 RepID=A0A261Y7T8_9FUNG|nr:hypothetical protein BZG36_00381 [Bifiguratus adelaidae]
MPPRLPSEDVYTSCYCEENVFLLVQKLVQLNRSLESQFWVVFISNEYGSVPLWAQRNQHAHDQPVIWDYHVIALYKDTLAQSLVFDMDSTLPYPCPLVQYMRKAVRIHMYDLPIRLQRKYRIVAATEFLKRFASDRSHMMRQGEFLAAPPSYPPIRTSESAMNLQSFLDCTLPGKVGDMGHEKGVEHMFDKHFKSKGVKAKVGYTGGNVSDPNYRQVCTGTTNHAEAVELTFQPSSVPYADLVEFFYRMHDPTTKNAQGPDRGTQYRSAIFYHSPEQKEIAEKVTAQVQKDHFKDKIVTEIVAAGQFWDAEEYHQKYLVKEPNGYECPTHFLRW